MCMRLLLFLQLLHRLVVPCSRSWRRFSISPCVSRYSLPFFYVSFVSSRLNHLQPSEEASPSCCSSCFRFRCLFDLIFSLVVHLFFVVLIPVLLDAFFFIIYIRLVAVTVMIIMIII